MAHTMRFRFVPEERGVLVAVLQAHPAVTCVSAQPDRFRFRIALAQTACCFVELGTDAGLVTFTPGEGDEPAALAEEMLREGGAVFPSAR